MNIRKIAMAMAATGLVLAPISAQAGTRASGVSAEKVAIASNARASKNVKKDNSAFNASVVIIALVGLGAAGFGVAAAGKSNNTPNPTNGS